MTTWEDAAPGGDPANIPDIEAPTIFECLRSRRRRAAILVLDRAGEIGRGELADVITRAENGGGTFSSSERKAVYVGLYQAHESKLVEAGVVEYASRRQDRWRATPLTHAVAEYIEEAYEKFGCYDREFVNIEKQRRKQ